MATQIDVLERGLESAPAAWSDSPVGQGSNVNSTPVLTATPPDCNALTVMFDGACPLCRREVSLYQGLTSLQPVMWKDVSVRDASVDEAQRLNYMSRFHVRLPGGELRSGGAAFVALWLTLPGWRWLGRMANLPGVTPLLERAYSGFLRYRPLLQRLLAHWDTSHLPPDLIGDLRSDHAGETGAVWIYRGILAVARDQGVREFAHRHVETEERHLREISAVFPALRRSWLLVPWRLAGWITGAVPALLGPRTVFATIAAVETFVDQHYQYQLDKLAGRPQYQSLYSLLEACQGDKRHHRDEALTLAQLPNGWLLATWCRLVGQGSAVAEWLARRI